MTELDQATGPQPKPGTAGGWARKKRVRLAASQKYEVFTSVLTNAATGREIAEKYKLDRSTIRSICATAKQGALDALAAAIPGRRGKSPEREALDAANERIAALEATVCEQAMRLHISEGKVRLGLNASPVPARVGGPAKEGICALVADVAAEGFSERQACCWIGIGHSRYLAWKQRLAAGRDLSDEPPGPPAGKARHARLSVAAGEPRQPGAVE
ncbi:MAG: hypothetical protein LBE08_06160 [Bifidobacteriaceae bacterium]|jgi:transposase|nr:hypothetical protein [Bifidobacteriaceae bacterium]